MNKKEYNAKRHTETQRKRIKSKQRKNYIKEDCTYSD